MTDTQRVTVVGLGLMGAAIARGLLRRGYAVTVWNRTAEKAEALVSEGAVAERNLDDAIAASPVSIWCLLDYSTTATLMALPENSAALRGRTAIPSATGGPDDVALAKRALDDAGATLLDAKIMFFPAQVGDTDAELLLSGDERAFADNRRMLSAVSGTCRFLGSDPAAASVLYTAVWSYDFASRYAYMEAAALVEASGLDLEDFRRSAALRTAQFAAQNEELSSRFAANDFEGDQATVDVYAEGMAPMLGAFARAGIDARLLGAVGLLSEAAQRAGHGLRDVSVIFDMLREEGA